MNRRLAHWGGLAALGLWSSSCNERAAVAPLLDAAGAESPTAEKTPGAGSQPIRLRGELLVQAWSPGPARRVGSTLSYGMACLGGPTPGERGEIELVLSHDPRSSCRQEPTDTSPHLSVRWAAGPDRRYFVGEELELGAFYSAPGLAAGALRARVRPLAIDFLEGRLRIDLRLEGIEFSTLSGVVDVPARFYEPPRTAETSTPSQGPVSGRVTGRDFRAGSVLAALGESGVVQFGVGVQELRFYRVPNVDCRYPNDAFFVRFSGYGPRPAGKSSQEMPIIGGTEDGRFVLGDPQPARAEAGVMEPSTSGQRFRGRFVGMTGPLGGAQLWHRDVRFEQATYAGNVLLDSSEACLEGSFAADLCQLSPDVEARLPFGPQPLGWFGMRPATRDPPGTVVGEIDGVPFAVGSALAFSSADGTARAIRLYRLEGVPCEWADDALFVELRTPTLGTRPAEVAFAYPTWNAAGDVRPLYRTGLLATERDQTALLTLSVLDADQLRGHIRWSGKAGRLEGPFSARLCRGTSAPAP